MGKKDKDAAAGVFKAIALDPEKWRLGHTKVFFRAGILGFMEETREDKIGSVLALLQAQARGKASRLVFKKMQDQKLALYCLQRTIRNWRIAEANIDKAVEECNKVIAVHDTLVASKNEYVLALQSGGSAVQDIIDKTNRVVAAKDDVQKQLN